MADFDICMNKSCEVNQRCYRYLAKPSKNQSYANFNSTKVKGEIICPGFKKMSVQEVIDIL
jgi:hypothetical protein